MMFGDIITDILAALAVVVNGIPQGLLALMYGFAGVPTALAFLVGIGGSLYYSSVASISFQAETITLAGTMGRDIRERLSMVFWGALILVIPSFFGMNEAIVQWIGKEIVLAMMAGVGLMLANVAIGMLASEKFSGSVSMVVALLVWFLTKNLAYTIIASAVAATLVYNFLLRKLKWDLDAPNTSITNEKFTLGNIEWRLWKNPKIIYGALAMACLNIGANISFGKITGSIANAEVNIDHLAVYSGLADMASTFFGGAPVESIISGTATAPHPLASSVIMMAIMAAILLLKLLPTIGKYVHSSSIAGFLFVLGLFVTFMDNMAATIAMTPGAADPGYGFTWWAMIIGATVFASARWNPFFGLLAGVAFKGAFWCLAYVGLIGGF